MKEYRSRIITAILSLFVFALLWFGIAGRLTWWRGWALLSIIIVYLTVLMWRLLKLNPDLVRERNRPASDAEAWDRVIMGVYNIALLVLLVVCALDGGRFVWSTVPLGLQGFGWLCLIISGALVWHVMMTNAFLSSYARIQSDRNQVVIQEGMYARIRHPMYLGIIIGFLGIPLVLNSWWGMIPSIVIIGLIIYRTYREDRMLIEGLSGYLQYTQKVRYRLIPRIW